MRIQPLTAVRWVAAILCLLSTLLSSHARPTSAQDNEPPKLVKTAQADLNGDGKPETIRIQVRGENAPSPNTPVSFTLTVGTLSVTGKFDDLDWCKGFRLVRLDSDKPLRQILVVGSGVGENYQAFLYEYNGRTLRRIGTLPDPDPEIPGNGVAYSSYWMGFWKRTDRYARDPRTGLLALTPQPAYAVGNIKVRVKTSFAVRFDHTDTAPIVASTAPGTEVELLVCWLPPTPPRDKARETTDQDWYLIRTAKGLVGWARLGTFKDKVDGLPWAG